MAIQFKNGMTISKMNEELEKGFIDNGSDIEIKNLFKEFDHFPFERTETGIKIISHFFCSYEDLCKFYVMWEENRNE